jgi:tetratricopeptide (TPR) repeat protein
MSKQMLVSFPIVLLLIDLRADRLSLTWQSLRGQAVEKLPYVMCCVVAVGVVLNAQQDTVAWANHSGLSLRVGHSIVAYGRYLLAAVYPVGLATFYPYPDGPPQPLQFIASAAVLIGITSWCGRQFKHDRRPMIGWCWFLIIMVPTIGLVRVGSQEMADRYAYFPFAGLYMMAGVAIAQLKTLPSGRIIHRVPGACLVVTLAGVCWVQTGYWRSSVALWEHADQCTTTNFTTDILYGQALHAAGSPDLAIARLEHGIDNVGNHYQTEKCSNAILLAGEIYVGNGELDKAKQCLDELDRRGTSPERVTFLLACTAFRLGDFDLAERNFEKHLQLLPEHADAWHKRACNSFAMGDQEHFSKTPQSGPVSGSETSRRSSPPLGH